MFLYHVNDIEHTIKIKYLSCHGGNLSYTSMIVYIKTVSFKNDVFSEIKRPIFKEHSWRLRFSILISTLSIMVSVISYSHI